MRPQVTEPLQPGKKTSGFGYWISKLDIIEYAKEFIGIRYKWGGNSADEGFDCSGYIQEILASQGIDPRGDQTAQQLYDFFSDITPYNIKVPRRGYLLFFGESTSDITHISMAMDDKFMIEAGGEGRIATSQGTVRVRPINNRKDLVAILQVI